MHVVVYAAEHDSPTARLLAAAAAAAADRCTLVRVRQSSAAGRLARVRGIARKARRRGLRWTARKLLHAAAERRLRGDYEAVAAAALAAHPLAAARPGFADELWVDSVNGEAAVAALRALAPDLILQNGAGILAEPVFALPRLGTWNLHHGWLPDIRGGDSLLWALLEGRPEWVGCSLHVIDSGIDTGPLLGRRRVDHAAGEHPGRIFARLTEAGVELLTDCLARAAAEDRVPYLDEAQASGRGVYRGMLDGGQLAALWERGFRP